MRKLMWFTVGFAAACAVGAYLVSGIWLLLLALFCLVGLVACGFLLGKQGKAPMLVFFGLMSAFVWMWAFDALYLSVPRDYDGERIHTQVQVADYGREVKNGISCDGSITLEGRPYRIRLYIYDDLELQPGDIVSGSMNLNSALDREQADYYGSAGVYLIGHMNGPAAVEPAKTQSWRYMAAHLRQKITGLLEETFPDDTLAFARALLLGDTGGLDYETNMDLAVSGIRHVVSVSGLHVSVLCAMLYGVLGYRKILTPAIGLPMLLLFAAVAGFTPSVNRACIMQALMMLSFSMKKEYDPPTALAFASLVMLIANPMTIASVGFQLSAGCVLGMLLFAGKIRDYLLHEKRLGPAKGKGFMARLKRGIAGSVSITLSTMVVTTPLCALYFDTVSLVSVLTNLLTLSVTSLAFYGIIAACVCGAVWLPLGRAIAWAVSWLMRYILLVAKGLSSFPLAAVYTHSGYIVAWLVGCYVLLAVWYLQKNKQTVVLFCCMAASLGIAIGASWLEPRTDAYRVTVLDVGQGQCILVSTGGEHYMIDCGGDSSEDAATLAAQTLLSQGITRLDGIILTHYDDDHAAGVEYFLTRFPADTLYLPNLPDDGTVQSSLIRSHYGNIRWLQPNTGTTLANGALTLLVGRSGTDDNESGLCVLCQLKNCDILVTGDRNQASERALLRQADLPDVDILVAGHHGSGNSTGPVLLEAVQPETVLISVGRHNPYGHPSETLLQRLRERGCRIVTTAENGTITIRG